MSAPEAFIIAGPNGSGKSTLTDHLVEYGIALPEAYINPDVIARSLLEREPEALQEERNRKAFEEGRRLRQEYRERGISFALETVFSHPSGLLDLQKLQEAGYRITLAVVTTSDPEINVRRVAGRVKTGGHAVEEKKIRERHKRFMALLPRMVEMANRVFVFDASDVTQLCYIRDRIPIEINMPAYLRRALLEPLAQREQARLQVAAQVLPEEIMELPNEENGSYEGLLRVSTPHYHLQEIAAGHCIRHDALLLTAPMEVGKKVRVIYHDGDGQLEEI